MSYSYEPSENQFDYAAAHNMGLWTPPEPPEPPEGEFIWSTTMNWN